MKYFDVDNARRHFALKIGVLGDLPLKRRASRVRRFVIQDWCGVAMASGLGVLRGRALSREISQHPIPRPRPGGTGGPWQLASGVGV